MLYGLGITQSDSRKAGLHQLPLIMCNQHISRCQTKGSTNSERTKDVSNALLLCLSCAPADNFTHRNGNALPCGFFSEIKLKRFRWKYGYSLLKNGQTFSYAYHRKKWISGRIYPLSDF